MKTLLNPMIEQWLGVMIKAGLIWLSGHLLSDAQMEGLDFDGLAVAITPGLIGIGWAFWTAFKGRQKLVMAMSLDTPVSENQLKELIKSPETPTPSVSTMKTDVACCPPADVPPAA